MNLGLWGSPPAPRTNEASPPVLLAAVTPLSAACSAGRSAGIWQPGRFPPRGVHSHTRALGGAAEPALPVSRAWLHIPAAQFLPPGRPCLSEPHFLSCPGGDEGAVTQRAEGSSRVLSVWPTTGARFSAELPTALSPHQRVLDPRPFHSRKH